MKKTIVIVILVVYIASIAVVNFFGLSIKEFDGVEYVQEIKCNGITVMNENPKTYGVYETAEDGTPVYHFNFIDGKYTDDPASIASNPNAVRIDYEVLPHTADGSKVDFIFEEKNYVHFDEETRTFVFLRNNRSLSVTIVSTDGSNIKTTIVIKSRTMKNQ
ncbi:MAG: hypothetical protein IJD75_05010 [Clostridia bacterium]|nr:hypothetical protein [Clostridia bacterium]